MSSVKELFLQRKKIDEEINDLVKKRLSKLGSKVKHMRNQNHLTQKELADNLGLTRTQITNIELGNSGVTLETLILLSDFFLTSPNFILGY